MLAISRAITDENRPQSRPSIVSSASRMLASPVWSAICMACEVVESA